MLLLLTADKFDKTRIYVQEKTSNIILPNGLFSRIIYSTSTYTMNGIFISTALYGTTEPYFNKYKLTFNKPFESNDAIQRLCKIERDILSIIQTTKTKHYKIQENLRIGHIKFYLDSYPQNINIILKISGIWETSDSVGITYKYIIVPPMIRNTNANTNANSK